MREDNRKSAKQFARKILRTRNKVPFMSGTAPVGTAWSQARALADHGLPQAAWAKLKRIEIKDDHHQWAAAQLLDKAGAVHLSHNILRRQLTSFRKVSPVGSARKAWTTAYPRPLRKLMDRSSRAAGIPSDLARSITREESGFNPGIESSANAIGLMQLILPTAKAMGERKDGRVTRSRLRQPDLNVQLGTRYLGRVLQRSGAVPQLVPAGYNAGTGALKRWLKQRGQLPLDLFVELIPYEEARGYTKRVNQSWAIYRHLYGKDKDPIYLSQRTMMPRKKKVRRKKKKRKRKRGR
jgi:soluble lytic murein transglycosylase-like protein